MKTPSILQSAVDTVTAPRRPVSLGKHTEDYSTESRELVVTGRLWCGATSRHEYSLTDAQHPVTLADAKRIAGDFESLEKARIRVTRRTVSETVENFRLIRA